MEFKGNLMIMIRLNKPAVLLLFVVLTALALPSGAPAQIAVGVSIHIGPPALPVYVQPVCPAPGYIWAPGYWAYGPAGYYWVPGTWVLAPTPGYLWTPGYWGWGGGVYLWHAGYWGPHVGFYGGINYGFGYGGVGFVGGEWRGGVFHYNTAVTNVNTTVIHNTYVNNTVVNRTVVNNVSYNGGAGGVTAQPTAQERTAMNEHHVEATALQTQHEEAARNDRSMLASENHGRPAVAATAHPGVFKGAGVVAAHAAGNSNRPNNMQADRPPSARTNSTSNYSANRPNNVNSNSHSEDRPPQSATHSENAHSNQNNSNHPNNSQGNANHNNNNNHPNSSKPPQHENKPPEHESHQGGGHER
jgi:YXWGXW repeat-containing protein